MLSNNIECKIIVHDGIKFKKKTLNFIQIINNYGVDNMYGLIEQTHVILKYLNQNTIDERIIITLKN